MKKLFFHGKANFRGSFLAKIVKKNNIEKHCKQKEEALLVNQFDNKIKNLYRETCFNYIIISSNKLKNIPKEETKKVFWTKEDLTFLAAGDLVELTSTNKGKARLLVIYRKKSESNTLVLTNLCNNACLTCPSPLKKLSNNQKIDFDKIVKRTKKIIKLVDKNTQVLGISGGEPTLLKEHLVDILDICQKELPRAKINLLSNGRMFSYLSYVDAIKSVSLRNLEIGVALYSCSSKIHDQITMVSGSFRQTVEGLKNLLSKGLNVELRILISKLNYKDLDQISKFIISNLYGVSKVCFLGMELSGRACLNTEKVWISYKKIKPYLQKACLRLLASGIPTYIFNIPLCKLDSPFRIICVKSISDYKIRYLPKCNKCLKKHLCGGIFSTSLPKIKEEGVVAIDE